MSTKIYSTNIVKASRSVNAAAVFNNIAFRVQLNRAHNDINCFYDNKYWTYCSLKIQAEQLGMTIPMIRTALDKLEKIGLIESLYAPHMEECHLVQHKDIPTKWYTISNLGWDTLGDDIKAVNTFIDNAQKGKKPLNDNNSTYNIYAETIETI